LGHGANTLPEEKQDEHLEASAETREGATTDESQASGGDQTSGVEQKEVPDDAVPTSQDRTEDAPQGHGADNESEENQDDNIASSEAVREGAGDAPPAEKTDHPVDTSATGGADSRAPPPSDPVPTPFVTSSQPKEDAPLGHGANNETEGKQEENLASSQLVREGAGDAPSGKSGASHARVDSVQDAPANAVPSPHVTSSSPKEDAPLGYGANSEPESKQEDNLAGSEDVREGAGLESTYEKAATGGEEKKDTTEPVEEQSAGSQAQPEQSGEVVAPLPLTEEKSAEDKPAEESKTEDNAPAQQETTSEAIAAPLPLTEEKPTEEAKTDEPASAQQDATAESASASLPLTEDKAAEETQTGDKTEVNPTDKTSESAAAPLPLTQDKAAEETKTDDSTSAPPAEISPESATAPLTEDKAPSSEPNKADDDTAPPFETTAESAPVPLTETKAAGEDSKADGSAPAPAAGKTGNQADPSTQPGNSATQTTGVVGEEYTPAGTAQTDAPSDAQREEGPEKALPVVGGAASKALPAPGDDIGEIPPAQVEESNDGSGAADQPADSTAGAAATAIDTAVEPTSGEETIPKEAADAAADTARTEQTTTEPTSKEPGDPKESDDAVAGAGAEEAADEDKDKPKKHPEVHPGQQNEGGIPTAGGEKLGTKHWGESDVVPDVPKKQTGKCAHSTHRRRGTDRETLELMALLADENTTGDDARQAGDGEGGDSEGGKKSLVTKIGETIQKVEEKLHIKKT
jgi:hypothetical protein